MRRFFLTFALCGVLFAPTACVPRAIREEHDRRAAVIAKMERDYQELLQREGATQADKDKVLGDLNAAKDELAKAQAEAKAAAVDKGLGTAQGALESAGPLVAIFLPAVGRILVSAAAFIGGIRVNKGGAA